MKIIKDIVDFIKDEIEGSEEYIEFAIKLKNDGNPNFKTFLDLAQVELDHASTTLHNVAISEINKQKEIMKANNQEVPKYMQTMWDEEHAELVKKSSEIKYEIEMLKK